MAKKKVERKARILIVTPEITYLPQGMGNMANYLQAKAGGLADVSASLVTVLFEKGADVHVTLPHYQRMFTVDVGRLISDELRVYKNRIPGDRIHLAEDRCFYYRDAVYSYNQPQENVKIALAFQREVINNIIPTVQPDLIHCNDWMTGLVPAAAKALGIPSVFTLHNIHTIKTTMAHIEDRGIDAYSFWEHLFFEQYPENYENARFSNPVDFLVSGVFASDFVNTVSPTFLEEIVEGKHSFIASNLLSELRNKKEQNRAGGVLNAPDMKYHPAQDEFIGKRYRSGEVEEGKAENKKILQEQFNLIVDPDAPLFFWPSRLDPVQKGPELLAHILYELTVQFPTMQVVFVANGPYQHHFKDIVKFHNLYKRVAVSDFDEKLSRRGYAGADFLFMPSRFEPCGLPQMVGPKYGTLPIACDTGGIHDTVSEMDFDMETGNGFLFQDYSIEGLWWGIEKALQFYQKPKPWRTKQLQRVMKDADHRFNHMRTAEQYIAIYKKVLGLK